MNELEIAQAVADQMYADDRASKSLGITIDLIEPGVAIATMTVRDDMVNGHAVCYGGFIFSLADSAFAFACNSYNDATVAAGADISFVRPANVGDQLTAVAREVRRGKRSGIYDVEIRNQDERMVALFRGRSAGLGRPTLRD